MYLTITSQSDCNALQADLTKLETWESEWLMAFNPDKCEVIRITNKKKPTPIMYTLHGIVTNSRAKPQQTPSVEKHAHPLRVVYCAIYSTLTRFTKFRV